MTDIVQRLLKLAERERPYGSLPDTLDEAAAEIERLRAALELFACDCIESGDLCPSPQNCRNYIARAALEQEKGGQ